MTQIVDLTAAITTETEVIGQPRVILESIHTHEEHGRANTKFSMTFHTGTHVDAPRHFDHNGIDIKNLHLDRPIGPSIPTGLRDKAKAKTAITAEDIRQSPGFAETLADLIVILQIGWNEKIVRKAQLLHGQSISEYENRALVGGTGNSRPGARHSSRKVFRDAAPWGLPGPPNFFGKRNPLHRAPTQPEPNQPEPFPEDRTAHQSRRRRGRTGARHCNPGLMARSHGCKVSPPKFV